MEFNALILVLVVVVLSWLYLKHRGGKVAGKSIPGPKGLPLFGYLAINPAKMHLAFYEWANEFGPIFQAEFFGRRVIVLNDAAVIRKAFSSDEYHEYFSNRPKSFASKHILQKHKDLALSTEYNKKSILLRKMLHKCLLFQSNGRSPFEYHVNKEISRFVELIEKHDGGDFDMKQMLRQSFGNLTSILLSGREPEVEDSRLLWSYNSDLILLLTTSLDLILKMFPFVKYLPCSTGDLIRRTIDSQEKLLTKYLSQNEIGESGLVASLRKFQEEENRKSECEVISDENVKGILLDVIIAGMTSSTIAINTTVLLLLNHPECMKSVQTEIDETIGRSHSPTVSDKNNMPFLMACILEMFRYSSFGPLGLPHLVRDDVEFDGYHFSKGAIIYANLWYTHRDKTQWNDPWEFRPNRFLCDSGKLLPPSHKFRQNLIPFLVGKRSCPGADYSISRVFLYLASLLQKFDIQPPRQVPLAVCDPNLFSPGLFMEPKDFLCQTVKW